MSDKKAPMEKMNTARVTKQERSMLEIVRALRRLGWHERLAALRAALILVGMATEEGKLR